MQARQSDDSDLLTPHLMASLSEMSEKPGPSDLLMGNATTVIEADQVPETTPLKIPSTHETLTAQIIPGHDPKPITPPTPRTRALVCTWPARLPLPARFRDAIPSSTTPPTLPTLPTSPRPTRHTRKPLSTHEYPPLLLHSHTHQPKRSRRRFLCTFILLALSHVQMGIDQQGSAFSSTAVGATGASVLRASTLTDINAPGELQTYGGPYDGPQTTQSPYDGPQTTQSAEDGDDEALHARAVNPPSSSAAMPLKKRAV